MIQDINAFSDEIESPAVEPENPQETTPVSEDTPQTDQTQPSAPVDKPAQSDDQPLPKRTVLVRYGKVGLVGQFRHNERELPSIHTKVVVQTDRGLELGEIISPSAAHNRLHCIIPREKIDEYIKNSGGAEYPFSRNGRLVRLATVQDLNEHRHIEQNIAKEASYCKEMITNFKLPMKLVDVEHLFGGDRIIFYFMADGRVDFRDLVRDMGKQFSTRIEMRQIGARDEARLVGDFDTCGRELCCKTFLKVLLPVNMRMAKVQRTTLDPSKISGRCGRLKCCLRYENEGYEELEAKLPRQGRLVLSEYGVGTVMETMVLTQLVKIQLQDSGRTIAVNVAELLDTRYDPAKSPPPPPPKPIPTPLGMGGGPEPFTPPEPKQKSESTPSDSSQDNRRQRSRRRDRGRGRDQRSGQGSPPPAQNQQGSPQDSAQPGAAGQSDGQKKKRRRRRRGRGKQGPSPNAE